MKVLVACEFSGVVRDSFRELGYDAFSCDFEPCMSDPSFHLQCDVMEVINDGWDMMIAHPPCTYLTNSGVRWLFKAGSKVNGVDHKRWKNMVDGALFFKKLLRADIPRICVENPIPHKYAANYIGKKYNQIIHPWQFGHGEQKQTCLWLKNLPELKPTEIVSGREQRIWKLPPSKDRGKLRSITYAGIGKAMANQYGKILNI